MNVISVNTHHTEHPFQKEMLQKLWEPITIAGVTSPNRIAFAPIGNTVPHTFPDMPQTSILVHEAIARGGTGMVVVGEADVTPDHPGKVDSCSNVSVNSRNTKGIWRDDAIPGWAELIERCHKWGATIWPQLSSHAPWLPGRDPEKWRIPGKAAPRWKELGMTPEAIEEEKNNFVAGALRAQKAGADGVQLHGTRESLVAIMISEKRNPGVPGYCEGFKERVRFATECIRGIKEACGKDFAIVQRLSSTEYISDGFDIEYTKLVAREYAEAGVDAIDVAQAGYETMVPQLQMVDPGGAYAHWARTIKTYLTSLGPPYSEVAIWNTCRIQNPWVAASMIRNGSCDAVSLCRQLLADQEWGNKIKEGRIDDIIPCLGDVWCQGHPTCSLNPQSLFHKTPELIESLKMTKAGKVKKVLVAGGGESGMEAARALALRGHKVTLYEKEEELGRMLYVQSRAPFRTDMDLARKYLSTQVRKLGVDVRCNQEVTAALVEKEKPDAVVVATGASPKLPEIPGINRPNVVFAEDVLLENVDVGKKVVVIDADPGHDVASLGSYVAQFAARSACVRDDVAVHIARWSPQHTPEQAMAMSDTPVGRQVTIVTRRGRIADVHYHHYTTMADLRRLGVTVIVGCEYKEINDKGLVITRGKNEELLEADTIITANYESSDELYKELEGKVSELHLIGDAKAVQIQLIAPIHEGYRAALAV
ncbi:FAD-dependent oxidoreductase [Chloroflexota bacterium]